MSTLPGADLADPGRQDAGLWILKASLLVVPFIYLPGYYRGMHYPKLLALQILVCALAICCMTARTLWCSRRSFLIAPVALLLVITALQSLRSFNASDALLTLATQVSFGLLALLAAFLVPAGGELSLIRFSVATGLVMGLLGISEQLGLWLPPSAGRPGATFGFRNIAAMYLAVNLPLSFALVMRRTSRDFYLGLLAAVSMGIFLVMTRTRGAWLGIALATSTALVVLARARVSGGDSWIRIAWRKSTPGRRWLIPVAAIALLALGNISPRYDDDNLHRLDEKKTGVTTTVASVWHPGGDRGRFKIWRHTLEMIWDSPVSGVGLGNWSVLYPRFDAGDALVLESAPRRPHNDLLWIWAELGPAGLLLHIWIIVLVVRAMFSRTSHRGEDDPTIIVWMAAGVLSLFVQSVFSFPREQAAGSFLCWLLIGLVARGGVDLAASGIRKVIRWGAVIALGVGLGGVWLMTKAIVFDGHYHESVLARDAGDSALQLEEARMARQAGIFDHRIFFQEGAALSDLGRYTEAIQSYRDYLVYQPYLPAIYNNLGRSLVPAGDSAGAETAYRRGLELFPDEPTLSNNLAILFKEKGDVTSALEIYEGGKNAEGFHNLGLIRAQEGALEAAEAAYKQALVRDPGMVEVYYSLGGLYLLMDQFEHSAETFETFLKNSPDNPTLERRTKSRLLQLYPVLGDRYMRTGDFNAAGHTFERMVDLGGGTAEIYGNLANVYGRRGEKVRAMAACRKAVDLDPNFAKAYFTLASLLDEAGEADEATKAYQDFLARWPEEDRFAVRARSRIEALAGAN